MKRGGPLKRTKSLVSRTKLKTRTPLKQTAGLKPVGAVKKRELAETSSVRSVYLVTHPRCEIGSVLSSNKIKGWKNCRGMAEGVHERKKRSQGGSLTDHVNLMSACNVCNGWVEDNPAEARRLGLAVRAHENPHLVPVLIGGKNYGRSHTS